MENSSKQQAIEIMALITQAEKTKQLSAIGYELMGKILKIVNNVDLAVAEKHVKEMKAKYPQDSPPELSKRLIREKCQRTGMVGAVTSGMGFIPGIGTAAAMTLGTAADVESTFKLQAELVLEIAVVYDYPLTETEKGEIIMVVTGLSSSGTALARQAGLAATEKLTEKIAQDAVVKALPVMGVIASASTNALSTYIIGQRADAYFRLGPDAVGSWNDSLRTISGVDERKIGHWLTESSKATGAALVAGASKAGKATSEAISIGADKAVEASKKAKEATSEAISMGAGKAVETSKKAREATSEAISMGAGKAVEASKKATSEAISMGAGKAVEGSKKMNQSGGIFGFIAWLIGFMWGIVTFILRNVGLIKK